MHERYLFDEHLKIIIYFKRSWEQQTRKDFKKNDIFF